LRKNQAGITAGSEIKEKARKGVHMSKEIRIIVAAHKKYQMPGDLMYMLVHVGAESNVYAKFSVA